MSWGEVRAARAAHEASLFRRANVVGIGVAHKVIAGEETDEPCVVVFVERKRPEDELRRRDIVPKALKGIRTDVVETGRFAARELVDPPTVDRTERIRPAPGGVSIAHERVTAGTLGVLATRDGRAVILSNNHILANENNALFGDPILQPGPADGGRAADAIAHLDDFVPIAFSERALGLKRLPTDGANIVDAAVGLPIAEDVVAPDILEIGRVIWSTNAEVGMRV